MAEAALFWDQPYFTEIIQECLSYLGETVRADKISIYFAPRVGHPMEPVYTWSVTGFKYIDRVTVKISPDKFYGRFESFRNLSEVYIPDLKQLFDSPDETNRLLHESEIRSLLGVPLVEAGSIIGLLELTTNEQTHQWSMDECRVIDITARFLKLALLHEHQKMLLMRKDEFLASISHELRTSLSTLLLTIENLRLQRRESSTELPQKAVRNIEKSSEQLLEIVNELVDLASLSSGRQVLHSERVDLVELCRSTIATLQTLAARNGIRLKVKIAGVPEQIEVDPTRLKQCLVNLLNISIRSTGDGGTVCLQVDGDQAAREISFTVWNMDMGVQALSEFSSQGNKIIGKISNHFPASANELGLAVAAGLVELLGGRISVEHSKESSSLNRYQLTLPFRQSIWERVAVFSSESPEMGMGLVSSREIPQTHREPLILIVDDNEANLLALRDALENESYRLEMARSGEEAVSRSLEIHPDLILMDIHMPGIGGLEAIRQIRSLDAIHDVPIIALTAFAMMEDRQKCLEAGANDYLAKPFRLKELYAMILAWLKSEPGVIV